MRQAPGPWYRRRHYWELTGQPDVDPVEFTPAAPGALDRARTRSLSDAPSLHASPPVRLEVVQGPWEEAGEEGGVLPEAAGASGAPPEGTGPGGALPAGAEAGDPLPKETGPGIAPPERTGPGLRDAASPVRSRRVDGPAPPPSGAALVLTVHHTALDGPACLRVLATAAEIYRGAADPPPAAPPVRAGAPEPGPLPPAPSPWARPARIRRGRPDPAPGNGLLLAALPVPGRPRGAPYTVNDQLLVATALTLAEWNRARGDRPRPLRLTMPVDDRDRGPDMPLGNGTRLVEVPFTAAELAAVLPLAALGGEALAALLRNTAARTRALKALDRPQLGRGAALVAAPCAPVAWRGALTRALRRAAGPWTSTSLLSNIGRVPYPLDFGPAGAARAVWFSAPARVPRGLTVTTASTAGRLHLALRWSTSLLGPEDGRALLDRFTHFLDATATGGPAPQSRGGEPGATAAGPRAAPPEAAEAVETPKAAEATEAAEGAEATQAAEDRLLPEGSEQEPR
ncbi:condensation protein [Streptomyces physcomitrii]